MDLEDGAILVATPDYYNRDLSGAVLLLRRDAAGFAAVDLTRLPTGTELVDATACGHWTEDEILSELEMNLWRVSSLDREAILREPSERRWEAAALAVGYLMPPAAKAKISWQP